MKALVTKFWISFFLPASLVQFLRRKGYAYPETSFTTSLTNAVLLLRWPFMRETLGFGWRGVTFCIAKCQSHCPLRVRILSISTLDGSRSGGDVRGQR